MSRLPQPGSDNGVWGDILNDFLLQEHTSAGALKIRTDGTLNAYYQKPGSGIPKTDFASSVQTTLNTSYPVINVTTYGATGDGSTDDTSAIQSALNAVPSSGATVVLPAGTYIISSTLTIDKDATILTGVGGGSTIRVSGGALGIDAIKIGNGSTTRAHCAVRNLHLDAASQKTGGTGILLSKCFKIWLENILVEKQYRSLGEYPVASCKIIALHVSLSGYRNSDFAANITVGPRLSH